MQSRTRKPKRQVQQIMLAKEKIEKIQDKLSISERFDHDLEINLAQQRVDLNKKRTKEFIDIQLKLKDYDWMYKKLCLT